MRNPHLAALLKEKGRNDEAVWTSITVNEGSVQHLDFLSQEDKDVFKTAFEIDQRWLIDLAAERAPEVCQSQSLNLFLPADVHKRDLHRLHFQAWKQGVKSLYYCRSKSIQRAESGVPADPGEGRTGVRPVPFLGRVNGEKPSPPGGGNDYEECLACQ